MSLCQQKGIIPLGDKEIMDNKGLVNESFFERMTRGIETPILKEERTSKIRKGKAKVDNLEQFYFRHIKSIEPLHTFEIPSIPPIIRNNEHSSTNKDFDDQDRSVASPSIVQVSNNYKEEESKKIEECLHKIDILFENGTFAGQEDAAVEKAVAATEEEIVAEEKVVEEEKDREEEESDVNIIIALESVGDNIDNLELDRVRSGEVAEITSKEQDNSLVIVVYTRPLHVAFPTQVATDDARVAFSKTMQCPKKRKESGPRTRSERKKRRKGEGRNIIYP
ncbi:hypothetical protein PVK06_047647 [Gossypium arboreum]|uniref:Uncharacterized protein n=1 Tax=Gossypium arboreum TaxID=29729 RepID=A0ABR0ME87_GOSAR|nr:hypothetical protein PVK06_047647 [Gossypium arboreum]